jgi:fructose-1-phosphate kinase PfkB-like protein
VACGAANTQTIGAGAFELRDVQRLAATVTVSPLASPVS